MTMFRAFTLFLGASILIFLALPHVSQACEGGTAVIIPDLESSNSTITWFCNEQPPTKTPHRTRKAKLLKPKAAEQAETFVLTTIPVPLWRPQEFEAVSEKVKPRVEATATVGIALEQTPLWPAGFGSDGACGSGYYPSGKDTTVLVQGCLKDTAVLWLADVPVQSHFLNLGYAAVQLSSMPKGCLALVEAVRMPATANVSFQGRWVKPDFMVTPGRGALSFAGKTVDTGTSTLGYEHVEGSCKGHLNIVTRAQIELISLVELTDLFRGNRF